MVLVGNDFAKFVEPSGVVAPRNPYFKIAVGAVFFGEVFEGAPIMALSVQAGIMRQTVLDCAADYCIGVDETVCFCDDEAVGVARHILV